MPSAEILTVIHESDHYAIVDKPALLDSQNSKEGRPSVVEYLEKKFRFAGLVHRLDFGTSGLMVAAKNPKAAKHLTSLLQAGKIHRHYLAIILGKILPKSSTIHSPLDGQDAITQYKVLEEFANASLVEVKLLTGRKHQIRKHFSELNHPLLGDHLYKKKGSHLLFTRPALHAFKLEIEDNSFECPIPEDMRLLLDRLRKTKSKL